MRKVLKDQLVDIAVSKCRDDENIEVFDDEKVVKVLRSPGGYWVEAYIWVALKEIAKPA